MPLAPLFNCSLFDHYPPPPNPRTPNSPRSTHILTPSSSRRRITLSNILVYIHYFCVIDIIYIYITLVSFIYKQYIRYALLLSGGFFLSFEDFWGMFYNSFHAHEFHSLGQDRSTGVQRAETTVAECTLTSCV